MRIKDAYDVLGLTDDADITVVKKQYRRRALETHPDRGGNPREFIQVQAAYEVLCAFFKTESDSEIEVPEELREIIDDLVRSFRRQAANSEEMCASIFAEFNKRMRNHIRTASRSQLKSFSDDFRSAWNQTMIGLFEHFNEECRTMIHKYESWFDKTTEATFEEMYQRELKGYRKAPAFYLIAIGLFGFGLLVAANVQLQPTLLAGLWRVSIALAPLALAWPIYRMYCESRRPSPNSIAPLSIQVFKVDPAAEFQGSAALKQGTRNTVAAGLAGAAIGDLISRGVGVPFVGAAAGFVIGGVVDRIANPTEGIRQMISEEYEQLMAFAEPQVTAYVVDSNQKLLEEIKVKIEANYEQRMKKVVLMLAEAR